MTAVDWTTGTGLAVYVGFGVVGDLLLSRGMRRMPRFTGLNLSEGLRFARHIVATPMVLAGVACLALNFGSLLTLLTRSDISVVGPCRALSYLLLAVLARSILGEQVSPKRWVGVSLVSAGVLVVLVTG